MQQLSPLGGGGGGGGGGIECKTFFKNYFYLRLLTGIKVLASGLLVHSLPELCYKKLHGSSTVIRTFFCLICDELYFIRHHLRVN